MPQTDLTERIIVVLLDRFVSNDRNEQSSPELRRFVNLIDQRMTASHGDRSVLGHFMISPMGTTAQQEFRQWLNQELVDQVFRDRLELALAPLLKSYGVQPSSESATASERQRVDAAVQREQIPRPLLAVGLIAVTLVIIFFTTTWNGSSKSSTSAGGHNGSVGSAGGQYTATPNGQPVPTVTTVGPPVAFLNVTGPSQSEVHGSVSLGAPVPAERTFNSAPAAMDRCPGIDLSRALAESFTITIAATAETTYGSLSVATKIVGPASTHYPVHVVETADGAQCGGGAASNDGVRYKMGAGGHELVEGWFLYPLAASTSGSADGLETIAPYELSISIRLADGGHNLSVYGPSACQNNLVQISGIRDMQQKCGLIPTPSA